MQEFLEPHGCTGSTRKMYGAESAQGPRLSPQLVWGQLGDQGWSHSTAICLCHLAFFVDFLQLCVAIAACMELA